jgi:hypothetical protein
LDVVGQPDAAVILSYSSFDKIKKNTANNSIISKQ